MDITDPTTITPKKETVSYLNTAGKTENFFVYSSKEQNIDAHSSTFITTTSYTKEIISIGEQVLRGQIMKLV